MPRLGELLVAAGALGEAQVEEGLRSQVVHGARLGTNLVELELCKLDDIAVALARIHGLPPALNRHFERCDVEVQELLPKSLADAHKVVPIGYLATEQRQVMVACRDPLTDIGKRELEVAMGLGRGGVVLSIAGELRILYFLERVYAIPRANRFLRVRRSTAVPIHFDVPHDDWGGGTATSEFQPEDSQYRSFEDTTGRFPPAPPDDEDTADQTTAARWSFDAAALEPFEPDDDFHIDETPIEHILEPPPPGHPRRPVRQPAELPEPPPVEVAPAHAPAPLGGEELRRFVETIAEAPAPAALGRVALRKVAVKPTSGEVVEAAAVASVFTAGATIEDIARAIRRGQTRNRVGDLAIGALRRFGEGLEAAVLFVLREDVAIGWKGYACGDEAAVDVLAIPLDTPSVLAAAARERRALLIDASHGSELDHRLAAALGRPEPGQIAVAPVILAEHPVALLYGQAARMTAHAELFAAVTSAITSAFARLLKAAQR